MTTELPQDEAGGMSKETKIGLAIICVLFAVFAAVLYVRLTGTDDPGTKLASANGKSDDKEKPADDDGDTDDADAEETVVVAGDESGTSGRPTQRTDENDDPLWARSATRNLAGGASDGGEQDNDEQDEDDESEIDSDTETRLAGRSRYNGNTTSGTLGSDYRQRHALGSKSGGRLAGRRPLAADADLESDVEPDELDEDSAGAFVASDDDSESGVDSADEQATDDESGEASALSDAEDETSEDGADAGESGLDDESEESGTTQVAAEDDDPTTDRRDESLAGMESDDNPSQRSELEADDDGETSARSVAAPKSRYPRDLRRDFGQLRKSGEVDLSPSPTSRKAAIALAKEAEQDAQEDAEGNDADTDEDESLADSSTSAAGRLSRPTANNPFAKNRSAAPRYNPRAGSGADSRFTNDDEAVDSQSAQESDESDAPDGDRTYVVREDDTLFDIARRELGKSSRWVEIYELNRERLGEDFEYLTPGMEIALPAASKTSYTAGRGANPRG